MQCKYCGKDIDEICEICPECGKKLKSNKIIFAIVGIVILAIIVILFVSLTLVKLGTNKKNENTIGNIRNFGYSLIDNKYIYYICPSEDGNSWCIKKSKVDGNKQSILFETNGAITSLNEKDDYIYFYCIEQADSIKSKICRINKNGGTVENLLENVSTNSFEIYVVNDNIFYVGEDRNIYKANLDGSNPVKLNDDKSGFLGVSSKWIFYNVNKKSEEKTTDEENVQDDLYKTETYIMDLNGENKHVLSSDRLYSINAIGDDIYYLSDDKKLCKIKDDGTDYKTILEDVTPYNINVTNNYIFYMDYIDENMNEIAIYRTNLDGSDKKEIRRLSYSSFLNAFNGYITFQDMSDFILLNVENNSEVKLYEDKTTEE